MAIFSFENGNLVPAQSVDLSVSRLGEETLTALRARALELIDEPLFPIAWTAESSPSGERESLIALDPSGQIVTVDVLARLSGEELIAALGAAGRHSDTSAEVLASLKGVTRADFEREWESFLDMCPPVPRSGPRLYLIVLAVEDEVRSAIEALAGAAVSVRQASVVGSGSQVFISVDELRPRMTSLSNLLATVPSRAQVEATSATVDEDSGVPVEPVEEAAAAPTEWVEPQATPSATAAPVTVSLRANSPETPDVVEVETVDEAPVTDDGEFVVEAEAEVEAETETEAAPEVPQEQVVQDEEQAVQEPPAFFPSRRALRQEREQRDDVQEAENAPATTSVYSVHSFNPNAQEGRHDSSNLTLSTFDISDRPPTPAQTQQSDAPTVPAPESAISVESTTSIPSAYSAESADLAEYAVKPEEKKSDEESRAKAIFASLPRFFSKSSDKRRAEQLLWEQAAPAREGRTHAQLSESTADSHSSDAVAQAAEQDF